MIFKKPIYVFPKNTKMYVTDNPNEAARRYVAGSKDTTDPVVSWCIEGCGKPEKVDAFMLLNHVVMNDLKQDSQRSQIVFGDDVDQKKNDVTEIPVKKKVGRPTKFNENDILRVMKAIEKYGFTKAAGKLGLAKSTLYEFRKRMKNQGLWPEDLPEK